MAGDRFYELPGDPVEANDRGLTLARLRGLRRAAASQPVFTIVGACAFHRDGARNECLIVDVELKVPQDVKVDIRPRERIVIWCNSADDDYPAVVALRRSFPITPHQFRRDPDQEPARLCVLETPFEEQRLTWNPTAFLAAIVRWLELTVTSELHPDDQPVEPFFYAIGLELIVPPDLVLATTHGKGTCAVADFTSRTVDQETPFTATLRVVSDQHLDALRHVGQPLCRVIVVSTDSREHGLIHMPPPTLGELATLLTPLGVNLKALLRENLLTMARDPKVGDRDRVVVLVHTPVSRRGVIVAESLAAFHFADDVAALGKALDVSVSINGRRQAALVLRPDEAKADALRLEAMDAYRDVSSPSAAAIAGTPSVARAVVLGVGALGSHVSSNLARSGWRRLTLVDHDHLRPHNLVRHVLPRGFVGRNKAVGMCEFLAGLWSDGEWTAVAKRAREATDDEGFTACLANADVILDCSASQAAARAVTLDWRSNARRISLFLTPNGQSGAVLAEDRERRVLLDAVEAQYYRMLLNDPVGDAHLTGTVPRHRYGLGCRDRTFVLSPDAIMTYSALFTKLSRERISATTASITILRSTDDGGIAVTMSEGALSHRVTYHRWTIVYDDSLLEKLHGLRDARVPNETGGPLLGYYDVERRIVYVVDALDAPPDSEESPEHFKRGVEGLAARLKQVGQRTGGVVGMIGDWHSHPPRVAPVPSQDDLNLLINEGLAMAEDGLPGLIAIVGDHDITFACAMDLANPGDNS